MKYSKLLKFLIGNFTFYAEGGEGGGATTPTPTPTPAATPTPTPTQEGSHAETFPRDYVENLRRENAAYRQRAQEAQAAAEAAQAAEAKATAEKAAAAEVAAAEAKKQVVELTERANQRVIRAELTSVAKEAGMIDMDDLPPADKLGVKLDDNGDVVGAKEAIDALKKSKPHLFEEPKKTTSQTKSAPGKTEAKQFDARKATSEELAADAKSRGYKIRTS